MGLAEALHDRTRALHTEAERSGVMGALLRGRASMDAYVRLLASLHAVYGALEHGLTAHAAHPVVGAMAAPDFARSEALDHDLRALLGAAWREAAPTHPLAYAYAEHLHRLAADAPERLLAHAWLRYLGDLNGGQVVARLVRRSPALARVATAFHEFPGLAEPRFAAAAWRARLDTLPLDEAARGAIVDEACAGFRRHIALFAELADQDAAEPSRSEA